MKYFFLLVFLFVAGSQLTIAQTPNCGVSDTNLPDSIIRLMRQAPQLLASQRARRAAAPRNICRVAVEIDSDTYLEFDKDTSRIRAQVLKQIDIVSQIYEREINTQLVVVRIHIWKDTELGPYRGETNIFTLLNKFATLWTAGFKEIPYDKAMYLFTKSVVGAGGVAAGVPGTYNISPLNSTGTIAHELGHNFGSVHTHNCSWPGGPIDYCAAIEGGNCYSASLETIQGTIMSYCQSGDTGFHPLCQAVMMAHAEKTMPKLITTPDKAPLLPTQTTLSASRYLYWDGQLLAERYDIEVSETADFTTKLVSDTAAVNGYDLSKLKAGKSYFIRVRAVNSFGVSAWSATSQLQIAELAAIAGQIPAPVLLSPAQDQLFVPYNDGNRSFSIEPVAGATSYEVQLAYGFDEIFQYPRTETRPSASFSVQYTVSGPVYWRVRAIVANKTGPWSSAGRFFVNAYQYSLSLSFNETASAFPFSYRPVTYSQSSRVVTTNVVVATNPLFTQPVYQKTLLSRNGNSVVGMMANLLPNTQYYVKVEEVNNGQIATYPAGVLSRLEQSFRTGSATLSTQWSFINNNIYPDLPQGQLSSIIPTGDALWIGSYSDGLFRIKPDSLTSQIVNRTTTNGKIGNQSMTIGEGKPGEVWLSNAISQYGGAPFASARQIGRLSNASGELTERTVLKPGNEYYYAFSVSPRLYYANSTIYAPKDDTLTKIYQSPANSSINKRIARPGLVWMTQYNSAIAAEELVELNLLTKTTRTFSSKNTPQLGTYFGDITFDALGNLWVSQSSNTYPFPALAKFNGQTWTAYQAPEIPFYYVSSLTTDSFGNMYAVGSGNPQKLYRYNGQAWQQMSEIPTQNRLGKMTVDGRGTIWFNGDYQVIRYNRCATIAAPTLSATKQIVEVSESLTLRAEGCISTVWSWSSVGETVTDQLIKGSNTLVVNPNSNTTYRARCYDDGCSGTEAKTDVAVLPRLSVTKTNKTAYCPGDPLTTTIGLLGSVDATNKYSLVLKSGSQSTRYVATGNDSELAIALPANLPPGRYVLYAESSSPAVRSRDSLQITVASVAAPKLSASKQTLEAGESIMLRAEGCSSVLWSWTSASGAVNDQLQKDTDLLTVNPVSNTTYLARCVNDGCQGANAVIGVAVTPRLSVMKANKTTYCPGSPLTVTIGLTGLVEVGNQYNLLLKSGSQLTRYPATSKEAELTAPLPATLTPGRYVVYVESSAPAVRSRDSVNIVVAPVPTAELSSSKPALMPGDSALISVALTGTPPWQFARWDQQAVQTAVSPYIASFKAGQQLAYKLTVSALTDAVCSSGVVKNELTVNLIPLANEPAAALGLSVYPNPTSGKLTVEATAPVLISSLQLMTMQGKQIKYERLSVPVRRAEWDIADAPAGAYLLHVKTADDKGVTWKLVKL